MKHNFQNIQAFFCKLVLLSTSVMIFTEGLKAQQQLLFTQYMFNGLAINPGYAGSDEALNITFLARQQWIGFDGAPNNQTLSFHKPTKNNNMAFGALLSREKVAVTEALNFYAVYAYKLKLKPGLLSFGLQGGITNHAQNLTELQLPPDVSDPSFDENLSKILPNFGVGLFFKAEKYYLGFSVPFLLQNSFESNDAVLLAKQFRHYFLSGGYLFDLNEELKLKPHFLLRNVQGSRPNIDLNANLLIKEKLWLGLSFRSSGSISGLLEFQVTDMLKLGLAYDLIFSGFDQNNSGSIESLINYRYMKPSGGRVLSPRYF